MVHWICPSFHMLEYLNGLHGLMQLLAFSGGDHWIMIRYSGEPQWICVWCQKKNSFVFKIMHAHPARAKGWPDRISEMYNCVYDLGYRVGLNIEFEHTSVGGRGGVFDCRLGFSAVPFWVRIPLITLIFGIAEKKGIWPLPFNSSEQWMELLHA